MVLENVAIMSCFYYVHMWYCYTTYVEANTGTPQDFASLEVVFLIHCSYIHMP